MMTEAEGGSEIVMKEFKLTRHDGRLRIESTVGVNESGVTWKSLLDEKLTGGIKHERIIAVTVKPLKGENSACLTLHHVHTYTKLPSIVTKKVVQEFSGTQETCDECAAVIRDLLKRDTNRPKRVLVILNPDSGNGGARRQYNNSVVPLAELMGIQLDLVVTKSQDHIGEVITDYDLSSIDIIVAMGGDGTFTLICSALLKRAQKDAGLDLNDLSIDLVKPSTAVAHLPAGTGNAIAGLSHYSRNDIDGCAISLFLGHRVPKDVSTIHSGGVFQDFSTLLTGYGMFATMVDSSERKRWMGKARYGVILWVMLKTPQTCEVDIDYLPAGSDTWQKYSGPVFGITHMPQFQIATNKEMCGNGLGDLSWIKPCSLKQRIKFMTCLLCQDVDLYKQDFMGHSVVTQFKITSRAPTNETKLARIVDWDGEVMAIPQPEYHVKIHKGLIDLIGLDDALVPDDYFEERRKSMIKNSTTQASQ